MKISSKGRYAVRVLAELGKQNKRLSVAGLAKLQGITVKYLEQIISLLRKHNLIESSRGQTGGYMLIKEYCRFAKIGCNVTRCRRSADLQGSRYVPYGLHSSPQDFPSC